jgi:hypothetical protein
MENKQEEVEKDFVEFRKEMEEEEPKKNEKQRNKKADNGKIHKTPKIIRYSIPIFIKITSFLIFLPGFY